MREGRTRPTLACSLAITAQLEPILSRLLPSPLLTALIALLARTRRCLALGRLHFAMLAVRAHGLQILA